MKYYVILSRSCEGTSNSAQVIRGRETLTAQRAENKGKEGGGEGGNGQ